MTERRGKGGLPRSVQKALAHADKQRAKRGKHLPPNVYTDRGAARAARQCEARTKHGRPCGFIVEPWRPLVKGKRLCHVHHPDGRYQRQVKARRVERAKREAEYQRARRELRAEWTEQAAVTVAPLIKAGVVRGPGAEQRRAAEARRAWEAKLLQQLEPGR